jgi:hypothetical protein
VNALLIQADHLKPWKRIVEMAFAAMEPDGQTDARQSMFYFYVSLADWKFAHQFLPSNPTEPTDLLFSVQTLLNLRETKKAQPIYRRCRRRLLKKFDFSEVLCEIESLAESTNLPTQGYVHDLEASFARVNATYFAGRMARPKLVWNRTLTGRKFGHFRRSADTVMLSVSLDAPDVPEFVVDFVMYHELLPKKHGVAIINGRRVAHGAAYRAEERQFANYHEAERVLKELAQRH